MIKAYHTDLTDFLDDSGELLPPLTNRARRMANHRGAIVEWTTAVLGMGAEKTNVHCRRRPNGRTCGGQILAAIDWESDAINWACSECRVGGVITGWMETPWDRSQLVDDEDAEEAEEIPMSDPFECWNETESAPWDFDDFV